MRVRRILKQVRENETADQSEREEEHDQEPTNLEYPLTNIFIGVIVPEEVTKHMLKSFSIGRKKMLKFAKDRLINKKVGF